MFGPTRRGVSPRPADNPRTRLIPVWLWIICGTLMALSLAVLLYLWQPWLPTQRGVVVPPGVGLENAGRTADADADSARTTDPDFQFYDVLPRQQVTPIPDEAIPETVTQSEITTPPETATAEADSQTADGTVIESTKYLLQVNSFDNPDEADRQQAAVMMAGQPADVRQTTTRSGEVWYRVVSGPYDGRDEAEQAQNRLADAGIDSLVVEGR